MAQAPQETPAEDKKRQLKLSEQVLYFLVGVLFLSSIAVNMAQGYILLSHQPEGTTDEEQLLERARDAQDSAELILSFLEGASVLIAAALGVAAIVGYRATQGLDELRRDLDNSAQMVKDLPKQLEEMRNLRDFLQPAFTTMLQAAQELNLSNYEEAYRLIQEAITLFPGNAQALYMAGWLETHYIPGKEDHALESLEHAMDLDPKSPSICAAYGVALRRKAKRSAGKERERYLEKSELQLRQALNDNPNLLDFNGESFWGPLAGTYRDTKQPDKAIESYTHALDITPISSYPAGNLAGLYLEKGDIETALDFFAKTVEYANLELRADPRSYFTRMDLAMAYTMLGHNDSVHLEHGREWLDTALKATATAQMINVSLVDGCERLLRNLPADRSWQEVATALQEMIATLKQEMSRRQAGNTDDPEA
jgi:tetratricopeptide (TPR) repeat protein